MKVCQIFNCAPHYRQSIFSAIDNNFKCDFYIGEVSNGIKELDYSCFNNRVYKVSLIKLLGGFTYMKGIPSLAFKREYDKYLVIGETHNVSIWLLGLYLRIFRPKIKLYFWTHGWYGKETKFERFLKYIFFHLPQGGIFLYGNYARNLMIKEGFNSNKLYVIHNSLSYEIQMKIRETISISELYHNHFGNTFPTLIFVGRLTKEKRLEMVFKAMKICKEKGLDLNFILIGKGIEDYLKTEAEIQGIENNVWFYGPCYDENELGKLISNADLCVSPGFVGLTAIHSMTYGTPVISHDDFPRQAPEFEAIKEGITGTFFSYGDSNSLANQIYAWIQNNKNRRDVVRKNCYEEIDTQWNPVFQINVIKKAFNS